MIRKENNEACMREYESMIFAAEMGDAPEVDLHEEDTHDGTRKVELFLDQQFMAGQKVVRIIHGRGTGKMRQVIHEMLESDQLVEYFRDSQVPKENMGVTYAVLSPRD